ncbi:MAG: tetratricopeptide repeat protein [Thermodesulfobacteriota bacterium]|nr:tetratricopeptide repeat protein [Thermodesulfobacteriota bacterium]
MKKNILLVYCLTLLFASTIQAADNSFGNLFEQANIAYTRAEYQQAINHYLTVAGKDGVSAPLLYNLANSYAANEQTGEAVINYERALRLSPGDADIQANLMQVRKDAGLYRDDKPLYERLAELLEADQWLMLSGAAFLLLAITTLAATLVNKFTPAMTRLIIIGSLLVIMTTLPAVLFRYQSWNDGVVVGQEARLLISPFPEAASTGTIKAGRLVRPGKKHGDFVLVQDETGRNGWLDQENSKWIAELPSN